jgi:hypothetical protein
MVSGERMKRIRIAPPRALVTDGAFSWGTFDGPVENVNLSDRWPRGLVRQWHRLRTKEWQAFQLMNDTHFVLGAIYDAKYLGLLQLVVVDIAAGSSQRWEHQVPPFRLNIARGLSGTSSEGTAGSLSMTIRNDVSNGRIAVRAHSAADGEVPAMKLDGVGSCAAAGGDGAHLVICHPFPDKTPLYSHKCVMAVEATLRIGDKEIRFARDTSLLILDDHKGHYPSPMRYDWVTGGRHDENGRRIAFNLTDNQIQDPDTFNENALFLDGDVQRLSAVRFERPAGVHKPWTVRDNEGRVEVTFTPAVRNEQHVGPRSALADYYGPFGWCSGWIEADSGERVSVDGCYGMGEQKLIRI